MSSKPTRKAESNVVSSTAIHIRATLASSGTESMRENEQIVEDVIELDALAIAHA